MFQEKEVERNLRVDSSEQRLLNVSAECLKTASEMMTYLMNDIPNSEEEWLRFYMYVFETQGPSQILLTLNKMLKINNKEDAITWKLLEKATFLFGLKYEEIQHMMPGKIRNVSDVNTKKMRLSSKGNYCISYSCMYGMNHSIDKFYLGFKNFVNWVYLNLILSIPDIKSTQKTNSKTFV